MSRPADVENNPNGASRTADNSSQSIARTIEADANGALSNDAGAAKIATDALQREAALLAHSGSATLKAVVAEIQQYDKTAAQKHLPNIDLHDITGHFGFDPRSEGYEPTIPGEQITATSTSGPGVIGQWLLHESNKQVSVEGER